MATTPAGLAALQQAVTDLTGAVNAATAALQASQQQQGDSDAAVASLAAEVETQVSTLKAATPAPPVAS